MRSLNVVELFAGVGGFRIGLERSSDRYRVVWSNQWEPSTRNQIASDIYVARFGPEGHANRDIANVPLKDIPAHDLLVGGFPCQDYSVARTLKHAAGLEGKKGVLWWQIHRILKGHRPGYFLLENVDRLLKSPAGQRGRDLAVMLASLADLGYAVEWRVVNAADYGMPQRRRRVFICGYRNGTGLERQLRAMKSKVDWIVHEGVFAEAFPSVEKDQGRSELVLEGDLVTLSADFNKLRKAKSPFLNAGVMVGRRVVSLDLSPVYDGARTALGDVLVPEDQVPGDFFIPTSQRKEWAYYKGGKQETRTNRSNGSTYTYAEGAMVFPDPLDRPSRTIVTGEGGGSPSRFKHVVNASKGRMRRLTPVELERLNMFPDGHTREASDSRRAFLMGNALVTGVIERIGKVLLDRIDELP